jgi:hypothetical protein
MKDARQILLMLLADIATSPTDPKQFIDGVAWSVTSALVDLTADANHRMVLDGQKIQPIEATWPEVEAWAKAQLQQMGVNT